MTTVDLAAGDQPTTEARPAGMWPGLALTANQLSIMAANLLLSLLLAASGGLATVGAVAPGILVFQFGCGVLQQVLAEASLLADAGTTRAVPLSVARAAVTVALIAGFAGAVLAAAATAGVPGGNPLLGLAYAAGIPAAHLLDIGRAAAVAHHRPRPAALEALGWGATLLACTGVAALVASPLWICAAWAAVNWVFAIGSAALSPARRPRLTGAWSWLLSQRRFAGAASVDALLTGLTPLLATQAAALVTSAATVGAIRIVQQLFAPLSFIAITARKLLIYRRSPDRAASRAGALRDGLIAAALVAAGAVLLGTALLVSRSAVASLAFLPAAGIVLLAGWEKVGQGLTFGVSLGKFVQRDFALLLRARYIFFALSVVGSPLAAIVWGPEGFLAAAGIASVVYSAALLGSRRWDTSR